MKNLRHFKLKFSCWFHSNSSRIDYRILKLNYPTCLPFESLCLVKIFSENHSFQTNFFEILNSFRNDEQSNFYDEFGRNISRKEFNFIISLNYLKNLKYFHFYSSSDF